MVTWKTGRKRFVNVLFLFDATYFAKVGKSVNSSVTIVDVASLLGNLCTFTQHKRVGTTKGLFYDIGKKKLINIEYFVDWLSKSDRLGKKKKKTTIAKMIKKIKQYHSSLNCHICFYFYANRPTNWNIIWNISAQNTPAETKTTVFVFLLYLCIVCRSMSLIFRIVTL